MFASDAKIKIEAAGLEESVEALKKVGAAIANAGVAMAGLNKAVQAVGAGGLKVEDLLNKMKEQEQEPQKLPSMSRNVWIGDDILPNIVEEVRRIEQEEEDIIDSLLNLDCKWDELNGMELFPPTSFATKPCSYENDIFGPAQMMHNVSAAVDRKEPLYYFNWKVDEWCLGIVEYISFPKAGSGQFRVLDLTRNKKDTLGYLWNEEYAGGQFRHFRYPDAHARHYFGRDADYVIRGALEVGGYGWVVAPESIEDGDKAFCFVLGSKGDYLVAYFPSIKYEPIKLMPRGQRLWMLREALSTPIIHLGKTPTVETQGELWGCTQFWEGGLY